MLTNPKNQKTSERVAIISAVKTYLGFFVLLVLVVEAVLGALAANTTGHIQLLTVYGMLFIILALIVVVSFFAYRKPEALLRSVGGQEVALSSPNWQQLQDFCFRVSGHWWEQIKQDEPSVLSFVEINPDAVTNTVKIKGRAFGQDGEVTAIWETEATCINPNQRKIFYYWTGWLHSRPNEPYEGFGEVSFQESNGPINSGFGFFLNMNVTDMKSAKKKSVEFRRCTEQEEQLIEKGGSKAVSDLVLVLGKLGT